MLNSTFFMKKAQPIINCHTHIFTADYVPPFLAKTIIPLGLYRLVHLGFFVAIARWWFNSRYSPYKWRFQRWYRVLARGLYRVKIAATRYWVWRLIKTVVGAVIVASIYHTIYTSLLKPWLKEKGVALYWFDKADEWLVSNGILIITDSILLKAFLLIILLLFFPSGRNLLWFLLRKFSAFFKMLPGKNTLHMIGRYINILRFARYKRQQDIFTKLTSQYPPETSMIVLPMDMEFMEAGKPARPYGDQMKELAALKQNRPDKIHTFLFVDPRRDKVGEQEFIKYSIKDNRVVLDANCFVKEYMEDKGFSGFKIYPALGYFPFDERLLPLWKYAADNCIPIMTHCIRGTIYYRGAKKKEWDFHPVFKQTMSGANDVTERYEPLLLPQMKPLDVQEIFTHPLNYACLLKKELLAELVAQAKDDRIRVLFGYNEKDHTIERGLEHLKICFGHFGGEDEWEKFFEKDRDNFASQLVRHPNVGIDFLYHDGMRRKGKPEQVWRYADWYSIICSLMLQHPNIYADISYILHGDVQIMPLLRFTLQHDTLKTRVLYGSDFYVVRNHKSDKNMLADMRAGLTEEEFEQIAGKNPIAYLQRCRPDEQ